MIEVSEDYEFHYQPGDLLLIYRRDISECKSFLLLNMGAWPGDHSYWWVVWISLRKGIKAFSRVPRTKNFRMLGSAHDLQVYHEDRKSVV